MDQIALGKRIKAAREKACMTQEELAAAVDYSVEGSKTVEVGRHRQCTQYWNR